MGRKRSPVASTDADADELPPVRPLARHHHRPSAGTDAMPLRSINRDGPAASAPDVPQQAPPNLGQSGQPTLNLDPARAPSAHQTAHQTALNGSDREKSMQKSTRSQQSEESAGRAKQMEKVLQRTDYMDVESDCSLGDQSASSAADMRKLKKEQKSSPQSAQSTQSATLQTKKSPRPKRSSRNNGSVGQRAESPTTPDPVPLGRNGVNATSTLSIASTTDQSTVAPPPALDRQGARLLRPGAFQSGRDLYNNNNNRHVSIVYDSMTIATTPKPAAAVMARMVKGDEDMEDRVKDRLQQHFEERMEREVRERMEQQRIAHTAVVTPAAVAVTSKLNPEPTVTAPEAAEPRWSKRMLYYGVAVTCLVIIVAVVVVLVLTVSPDKSSKEDASASQATPTEVPAASVSPSSLPTESPSSSPTSIMDLYVDLLLPILNRAPVFTEREVFEDATTAQYKAMEWLSDTYDLDQVQYNPTAGLTTVESAEELSVNDILNANDISLRHLIERYAAAVLYFATSGLNWPNDQLKFLSTNLSICDWNNAEDRIGIFCDESDGTVTELRFTDYFLGGTLPQEFYCFYKVRIVWLELNYWLYGTISTYIGALSELEQFDVGITEFYGSIPSEIGSLQKLQLFYAYSNSISGLIPTEIGSPALLQNIALHDSEIRGTLPREIGDLSLLEVLAVGDTYLHGPVPTELSNLKLLRHIQLEGTDLVGNLDPIFCLRDQGPVDVFYADCGEQGEFESPVACSCCTLCCVEGQDCWSPRQFGPDPCYFGECVWCGDSRFAESCNRCLETGDAGSVTTAEELCQASCEWDFDTATCRPREDFES